MSTGRLAPLRERDFRLFFGGETINTAGSSMGRLAMSFAVLHIDNSPTALGWVVAAWTVPMVAFMLLGEALADRLPRALVLRGCNLIQGVAQLTSAVLVLTGTAQLWHLIVLQFVAGTVTAVSYPAFHAMVPVLLPEPARKAAYLLLSQSQSALSIIGPALAGLIVAISSPGWALAVDAASYLVAAVFLALLRLPPQARPDRRESLLGDFSAGWSYARGLGWVIPIACCSLVFNALISGALFVLGPAIAKDTVGSVGWGLATGAEALGLFAFAFVLARVRLRRPLLACLGGFVTAAVPMLALAGWPSTAPLAVAFFITGCGGAVIGLSWNLTVQEKVPEEMLSRVMAIDGFFSFVAMPVGQLLVGPATLLFGAPAVEVGAAVLCVITLLVGATRRPLRDLRLRDPVPAAAATSVAG